MQTIFAFDVKLQLGIQNLPSKSKPDIKSQRQKPSQLSPKNHISSKSSNVPNVPKYPMLIYSIQVTVLVCRNSS